jgi:hypothetical protein
MPDELTAELITSKWRPEEVRLSPNGRLAAWSASPYGKDGDITTAAFLDRRIMTRLTVMSDSR